MGSDRFGYNPNSKGYQNKDVERADEREGWEGEREREREIEEHKQINIPTHVTPSIARTYPSKQLHSAVPLMFSQTP